MTQWCEQVHQDHQELASQASALESALTVDVPLNDRRVVLSWIVRTVWPMLELHLRKEEEALFPALRRLLGKDAGALQILKEQNREFRATHRHLAELIQDYDNLDWERIKLAVYSFMEILEDHEQKVKRLLLEVLEYSLKPHELKTLTKAFEEVARKACEQEGWPVHRPRPAGRSGDDVFGSAAAASALQPEEAGAFRHPLNS